MNKNIIISIIIPAYNVEKYIRETIKSLINQTYKNLEIIVVDDCSPDNTSAVVKSFIDKANIKYERFEKNRGASAAFNYGHQLATGDLIIYLDADNFLHPQTFEKAIEFLNDNQDCGAVYFNTFHFIDNDLKRRVYGHKTYNPSGLIFNDLIKGLISINLSRVLFRKEAINDIFFDESLRYGGDWDYWLAVASRDIKFNFLDKKFLYNRQRVSGNSCGGKGRFGSKKDYVITLKKWLNKLSREEIKKFKIDKKIKRAEIVAVLNLAEFSDKNEVFAELNKIKFIGIGGTLLKVLVGFFVVLPKKFIVLLFYFYYRLKDKENFKEIPCLTIEKTLEING